MVGGMLALRDNAFEAELAGMRTTDRRTRKSPLSVGSGAEPARPVTPRTWREMTWSERWRWLRTAGSERLTDGDLRAADELKAVLERMKEEAGFGKPTAPTARPGDGPESKIIRW